MSSLVLLEEGVCYDQCNLLTKLYQPLPCYCTLRPYLPVTPGVSYFYIPVPYNEKDIFLGCFGLLVLEGLLGLHRTVQLQLLQHCWSGHRLGLPWYWMVGQHRNQIDYILCSQRWRSSIQSAKARPGADCGSDHELLIAKFRLKLKKVGKTTRPFSYDLNQIPNDYTGKVRNRFKGLDLIDRVRD